jgi:hypothetical protein
LRLVKERVARDLVVIENDTYENEKNFLRTVYSDLNVPTEE